MTERADRRDPVLRGTDGPIRVAPAGPGRHPVASAFAGTLARNGCPVTDDLSGRDQEGVAWPDLAIADGERVSPADGYLRPALDRPNLAVAAGREVTRLNMRHGRCTGVGYVCDGVAADALVDAAAGQAAELYPGPEVRTDAALRDYVRRTVDSYYHPVGTCRMGSDDGAVVDPDLRVRGVAGLRVADASVMPLIPNAHPHATVLAIAERAAALITAPC